MIFLSADYDDRKGLMCIRCDVAEFYSLLPSFEAEIKPFLPQKGSVADDVFCRALCSVHIEAVLTLRALRILAYGDNTARGLLDKLMKTEVPGAFADREIAKKVVVDCVKKGLVREEEYALRLLEKWIREVRGVYFIEQKMKEKRFRPGLFEKLVDEDTRERIREALLTYVKAQKIQNPREKKRLTDGLVRRGFSYGEIFDALVAADREDFA